MAKRAWDLLRKAARCTARRVWKRRVLIVSLLGEGAVIALIAAAGVMLAGAFVPQAGDGPGWSKLFRTEDAGEYFSIYEYIHSFDTGLTEAEERELAVLIHDESEKYGYDPAFILAVIQTESAFKPTAVSNVGACGLMQIMPTTGKEIAKEVRMPYDGKTTLDKPDINVRMGMYYLFQMMLRFKDVRIALVAYNCGPGFVDEMQKRGYKLPSDYVDKVMGNYKRIKTQGL
jgi:hypothetical protein